MERVPSGVELTTAAIAFTHSRPRPGMAEPPGEVRLPLHFTDTQARKAAWSSEAAVLWAQDLSMTQGKFEDHRAKQLFETRMRHVGGVWCCQGTQGGYSYSPFLSG